MDGAQSLTDLFGNYRLLDKKKGNPLSERASLLSYFVSELKREPKVLGIRLAHYTLDAMYALKSGYADRLRRDGHTAAAKWFWYVTRTSKSP